MNHDCEVQLRAPCTSCGCVVGAVFKRNGQGVVYCRSCRSHQGYNASKVEMREQPRSVSTSHNVKPKVRIAVILRSGGRCVMCGRDPSNGVILTAGHLLSVKDGVALGVPDELINSEENLAAMCEECNLGLGAQSVPLWLAVAILQSRAAKEVYGARSSLEAMVR